MAWWLSNLRSSSHAGASPKSQVIWGQSMRSQLLKAWKLAHATSHGVPSMTWMSTWQHFLEVRAWDLCWGLVWAKNQTQLWTKFSQKRRLKIIKVQIFMILNLILMIYRGSKVGTLSPCWDLLTSVGLGTWCPMWIGPYDRFSSYSIIENQLSVTLRVWASS